MFVKFKVILIFLSVLSSLMLSCSNKDNNLLDIQFSKDSSAIVIKNIDKAGYAHLEQEYKKGALPSGLIDVLETPNEMDSISIEVEFPGELKVQEQEIIFIPKTPFIKGKNYIVTSFLNIQFGNSKDLLKNKLNSSLSPQHKTLLR